MIRRPRHILQSLPAGPWSAEQMFETIRIVNTLRADRAVTRSWAAQVLAEQIQRVSSAQNTGQIKTADANRYMVALLREIERQQSTHPRIFGRNSPLVFRGMTFDNLLLQDVRLSDAYFSICNFKGSNLSRSRFTRCTFSDCSFEQVDMRRANFVNSRLYGCIFRSALLDHVSFRTSAVARADFENASMSLTRGLPNRGG